ncbi:GGDEF domain-containing protein [Thiorhodococcus mannitoliphagus]|uniref:diguanylate cyclase n=1 Tax=Thiorhodococcus mannitoliphagus TaxID=329406 RepID=A0A6P1DVH3_9GAMM|nr:GGDEF domain-containing protein [Thiorhodococcus mannitoliphagus]NEX19694.1 GGDEF domain-containing protein [Thiorhodococcus mannitoliphagus]
MTSKVSDVLRYCPNLPSLPGVVVRIVEMGRDPDVNIGALAGLLAKDPALSSRMLRVCNSPLYGQRRTTTNLHQAVMLLGLNSTMTMALSFTLSDLFGAAKAQKSALERVWKRSIVTALAARKIGERAGLGSLDELYLGGLLQDLGILALYAAVPDRYLPLLEQYDDHQSFVRLERDALGYDHGEAGTWLMQHWGMPERLAMTALAVHSPDSDALDDEQKQFVYPVAVGAQLADFVLSEGSADAMESAASSASDWLGLAPDSLASLVEDVVTDLPEVGALFELEVVSQAMAFGLADQAREILATRNLRLIQQATEHHQRFIEMEQAAELLQKAAIHDALTGLHNRRHFDQILDIEFGLAIDNAWPLTLGFIDLDHFKQVNDTEGHLIGDAVLVKVAGVLKKNLRERDYIMRYGGEEFVVLLPGHGLEGALKVFERLRAAVEQTLHLGESGGRFHVTTSIGIAAHMDGECRLEDSIDLVRAADRALYDAKRLGRNRIVVAA